MVWLQVVTQEHVTVQYIVNSACGNITKTASLTVIGAPTVENIAGGALTVCTGSTTPAFTDATAGGTWSILNGTGTATIDLNGVVTGGNPGTVTVRYSVVGTCFTTVKTASLTVNALPTAFTLTGSTATCPANTGTITLNSQTGVSYQLKNSSNADVQAAKNGTGSTLTWTGVAVDNGYYVIATNSGNCTSQTNAVNVAAAPTPTVFTLTGSAICVANVGTMTLSSSTTGVTYQLKNSSNANVQGAKAGTGSTLNWTSLALGNGYYVVATGTGGCTSQTLAADVATGSAPAAYTITGGIICAANTGVVTLSNSDVGVNYQLKLGSNSNAQAAKAGTGSALTWTGLAANAGYHIVATAPGGCTSTTGNAAVTSGGLPMVYTLTGGSICTPNTGTLTLSNSQTGVTYQLKDNTNSDVQSAQSGTTGSALTWTALSAANGYYVVATNANGCTSQTAAANITTATPPTVFILTGSAICTPNTGTMNLSGSQLNVSYQLKNSSNANIQGAKAGTGAALNWTTLALGNGYYVVATASGGCTSQTLAADVAAGSGPTVYTITGGTICTPNTGVVTLSNSDVGVSYQLKLGSNSNAQAAQAGTGSALTWTGLAADNGYHIVATASGGCTSTTR